MRLAPFRQDLEGARRPGNEVQADRIGARRDRREETPLVCDAADLDDRPPRERSGILGLGAGCHKRTYGGGRIGRANERLSYERPVETDCPPGPDRRRVAHAGLGDREPVARHERPEAHSLLRGRTFARIFH